MLTTLLLVAIAATAFPGPGTSSSPDGRYHIVWQEPGSEAEEHRLLLEQKASGDRTVLYSFPRHVTVLWSPDSRRVAITDAHGSDESFIVVIPVADSAARIVIDRERIQSATAIPLVSDHHVYVEAIRWQSSRTLLIRAHGYGDAHPNGFAKRLVFSTADQSIHEAPAGT